MDNKNIIYVTEEMEGSRIDKFLSEQFSDLTRSYIQKLLKSNSILVNNTPVKASYKTTENDIITIDIPESITPEIIPENIPIDVVYEDSDVILINKPKGMVVHPAAGHYTGTLVNALMYHCKDDLSGINGVMRPGIVHRIDMDTTGILIVCKNDFSHNCIANQLKEHSIHRKYYAIVHGNLKMDEGTIDAPIGRHPVERKKMAIVSNGKHAVTHYKVIERFGNYTWVECQLETGRTHQIRVHMQSIGHPLLGDMVYGPSKCPFHLQGQTLHAYTLGFIHPRTNEFLSFEVPLPQYFEKLVNSLRNKK